MKSEPFPLIFWWLIKELEMKKELGLLKRGRPVNSNSERQKRLQALELKKLSGVEVKRGRPKMIKVEEAV
jgi:hypothetical protein